MDHPKLTALETEKDHLLVQLDEAILQEDYETVALLGQALVCLSREIREYRVSYPKGIGKQ